VRVDAEPVTVEVRVSAVRASHVPHRVAEHGRCHVVDRVKLINAEPSLGELHARDANSTERLIELLLTICGDPRMDVDATV
jgi:hypothetical protein